MKSFIVLCILFAGIVAPHSVFASSDRRDGNWWVGTSNENKSGYTVGMVDGINLGHNFSMWGMEQGTANPCASEAHESYEKVWVQYMNHVTVGQIKTGLDDFYSDYRNRKILVHDAMWIVLNSISGKSKEEVDKMTESWRKNAS